MKEKNNYDREIRKKIEEIRKFQAPVTKKPILDGKEIMDLLGIKPGPKVGEVGKYLIDMEDDYVERGRTLTKEEAKKKVLEKFAS